MKILLLNHNPIVSKLVKLCAAKIGYDFEEMQEFSPSAKVDVIIVDNDVSVDLKALRAHCDTLIYLSPKNKEVKEDVKVLHKPFLPTDLIALINPSLGDNTLEKTQPEPVNEAFSEDKEDNPYADLNLNLDDLNLSDLSDDEPKSEENLQTEESKDTEDEKHTQGAENESLEPEDTSKNAPKVGQEQISNEPESVDSEVPKHEAEKGEDEKFEESDLDKALKIDEHKAEDSTNDEVLKEATNNAQDVVESAQTETPQEVLENTQDEAPKEANDPAPESMQEPAQEMADNAQETQESLVSSTPQGDLIIPQDFSTEQAEALKELDLSLDDLKTGEPLLEDESELGSNQTHADENLQNDELLNLNEPKAPELSEPKQSEPELEATNDAQTKAQEVLENTQDETPKETNEPEASKEAEAQEIPANAQESLKQDEDLIIPQDFSTEQAEALKELDLGLDDLKMDEPLLEDESEPFGVEQKEDKMSFDDLPKDAKFLGQEPELEPKLDIVPSLVDEEFKPTLSTHEQIKEELSQLKDMDTQIDPNLSKIHEALQKDEIEPEQDNTSLDEDLKHISQRDIKIALGESVPKEEESALNLKDEVAQSAVKADENEEIISELGKSITSAITSSINDETLKAALKGMNMNINISINFDEDKH